MASDCAQQILGEKSSIFLVKRGKIWSSQASSGAAILSHTLVRAAAATTACAARREMRSPASSVDTEPTEPGPKRPGDQTSWGATRAIPRFGPFFVSPPAVFYRQEGLNRHLTVSYADVSYVWAQAFWRAPPAGPEAGEAYFWGAPFFRSPPLSGIEPTSI